MVAGDRADKDIPDRLPGAGPLLRFPSGLTGGILASDR